MAFVGAALPLNREGLTVAAAHVEVDPAALWSVVVVETSGCGFLPDRRPSSLSDWSLVIEGWNGALRCVNRRRDAERVGGVVKVLA